MSGGRALDDPQGQVSARQGDIRTWGDRGGAGYAGDSGNKGDAGDAGDMGDAG